MTTAAAAAVMAFGLICCSPHGAWDLLRLLSTQYLSRNEVIEAGNWERVREYLDWLASQGVSAPPTVDTGAITVAGVGNKWYGGVLTPDGRIFGIPGQATSVLVIDTQTGTASTTGIVPSGAFKWVGGVLAPNEKIYGIPCEADSVLIIDPTADPLDTTTKSDGILSTASKWCGGVLAPNGKIYGIPFNSPTVLVIEPSMDEFTTLDIPDPMGPFAPGDLAKWYGGVLAPNGKIYCIPFSADYVMVIDPAANTMVPDAIPVSAGGVGTWKWIGGVLASNGKIYCIPRDADRVLIIDPQRNTADYITGLPTVENKWAGGVLAPDGRIYAMPRDHNSVLVIDPTTDTANPSGVALPPSPPAPVDPSDPDKWTAGVLAPNGTIYGIPDLADGVLLLDVHSNGEFFASFAESGYFNKL